MNSHAIIVNETNTRKNDKVQINGFKVFNKNRTNGAMGGTLTAISDKHSADALKVSEGKKVEMIITRLGKFHPAINIVNVYGSQESRLTQEDIIVLKLGDYLTSEREIALVSFVVIWLKYIEENYSHQLHS